MNILRNVMVLMSGTLLAQMIPLILSPILSRLYSPEEFGEFALYTAIIGVLLVFSTMKYELAITLPKKLSEANNLLVICFLITILITFIIYCFLLFFWDDILFIMDLSLPNSWIYIIPLSVFLGGIYQSLNYYFIREQKYKELATNRIVQSSAIGGGNLFFAYIGLSAKGLIWGQVLGTFISCLILARNIFHKKIFSISWGDTKELLREYINFPKITVLSSLINSFYNNGRYLILGLFFGVGTLGQMFLMFRVLGVPSAVIGSAIADILFERVAFLNNQNINKQDIYKKMIKVWLVLMLIALVPTLILYFLGDMLFVLVFGDKWLYAGQLASLFAVSLFFEFSSSPFCRVFFVYKKDSLYLLWEFLRIVIIYVPLCYLSLSGASETILIYAMVSSITISYLLLVFLVFLVFKEKKIC